MAVESSSPAVIDSRAVVPLSPGAPAIDATFEERWAEWRARGLHDLAVHRRIRLVAVCIAIAAGLLTLGLVIAQGAR